MKELIISLILFALLLAGITCNAFFVRSVAEELMRYPERLKNTEQIDASLRELEEYWHQRKGFLALTVAHGELERVEELILSLKVSHEWGEEDAFARYCALLSVAAGEIQRSEQLPFTFFSYETNARSSTVS